MATWRIAWTEGLVDYNPWVRKESAMTEVTQHAYTQISQTNRKRAWLFEEENVGAVQYVEFQL